jgi:hypothetical protein
MGIRADLSKIARRTQETFLLEVLRDFPDATEEELIIALQSWKSLHNKTEKELTIYAETGCWPKLKES